MRDTKTESDILQIIIKDNHMMSKPIAQEMVASVMAMKLPPAEALKSARGLSATVARTASDMAAVEFGEVCRSNGGLVDKLTDEQWNIVTRDRDEWIEWCTSTDPALRETTEEVITDFYLRINQAPPEFVWLDGPRRCVEVIAMIEGGMSRELAIQTTWATYTLGMSASEVKAAKAEKRKAVASTMYSAEYGHWVAHYMICTRLLTYDDVELLHQWARLVKSGGWWMPYEGVVFCAERHKRIVFDEERRLHSAVGCAIETRDGDKLYSWHGVRVPGEWIEDPDAVDVSVALTWPNIEQRRCAAEIIGWDRILDKLDVKVIDTNEDPEIGTLVECDIPDSGTNRFLRVRCGTGREFAVVVGMEVDTALAAQARIYNTTEDVISMMSVRT